VPGPLRLAITTLGCKVNRADAEALLGRLRGLAVEVPFSAAADVYVVNSCTVTAVAERQSRQLTYRARRRNPAARVILTGCMAAVGEQLPAADRVFPHARHEELVQYVAGLAGEHRSERAEQQQQLPRPPPQHNWRARPFLKVQDGCDDACAYCIVPRARGPSRSCLTPKEVDEALARLAARGYQEVVLTGIHLGRYGRDLDPPRTLAGLLRACAGRVARLRLSSIEPLEVEPALEELLAEGRVCPHLHVPVQSGSDRILAAMNRPYEIRGFRALLERLRRRLPDAALGTDLIAGFPGEREADFEASLRLVQEAPLTHLHVFPFSARPGTPAAAAADPVPPAVAKERAARLREAGQRKLRAFARAQLGRERAVLIEQRQRGDGRLTGVSDNYLRVVLEEGGDELVGRLVQVTLVAEEEGLLTGRA
jgi:threonylcarbamoyladenosine tRNA methylthiotransferase MtaB